MSGPFISIIIPCRRIDKHVKECLNHCLKLDYQNFEIILLPDDKLEQKLSFDSDKIRILPTDAVKPSIKRNLAIRNSRADILAFIDADAYPVPTWLKAALKYFNDENIGIVGGPNITPPADSLSQKASGEIFSSVVGTGLTSLRYLARRKFRRSLPVKEMPSCNLLVRRELAQKVGGFDSKFLTGEDSKFCFRARKLGKKIINAPDVIVYHHRRQLFWAHFKQVWIYARDKAWLIKEDFSWDKLYYFIPSFFILGLIGGLIIWPIYWLRLIYLAVIALYLLMVLLASLRRLAIAPLIFMGIILTHILYGLSFIWGLIIKQT